MTVGIVAGAVVFGMSDCGGKPAPPIDTGIDAGPGLAEIDALEAEQARQRAVRLRDIEEKRRKDLAAISGEQRREYDAVRAEGPDAVLTWLREFDEQQFADAGSVSSRSSSP